MKLAGRGIIITGASQGLGKAVAQACLSAGANLCLCARNGELLEQTGEQLRRQAAPEQLVITQVSDVSKPDQVQQLIERATSELPHLDGLVNNAGIYGPKGLIEEVDWQEWFAAVEINLMGTVLPCRAILPTFRKQQAGKIVNLSGGGATAPMPRFSAYAAAKAAVVRFTETLAEETRDANIDVNAVAPGALNTRLLDEILDAGPERVGQQMYQRALSQKESGGVPLESGAALCVFLLSAESDSITGKLLSAVWDPWSELPARKAALQSDIYTLRRIVPKDRGCDWGG